MNITETGISSCPFNLFKISWKNCLEGRFYESEKNFLFFDRIREEEDVLRDDGVMDLGIGDRSVLLGRPLFLIGGLSAHYLTSFTPNASLCLDSFCIVGVS